MRKFVLGYLVVSDDHSLKYFYCRCPGLVKYRKGFLQADLRVFMGYVPCLQTPDRLGVSTGLVFLWPPRLVFLYMIRST